MTKGLPTKQSLNAHIICRFLDPLLNNSLVMANKSENEVREWMSQVLRKPLPGDLWQALQDGVILCQLAGAICPGSATDINYSNTPGAAAENTRHFIETCVSLGVVYEELFSVGDLNHKHKFDRVLKCILALDACAAALGYGGPTLSPRPQRQFQHQDTPRYCQCAQIKQPSAL